MQSRYRLILSNKNIYREIDLIPSMTELKVGTTVDCDVRLRKELFFGSIVLTFVQNQGVWTVFCSDNLYVSVGDVQKLVTRQLQHGDELRVKYQKNNNDVFAMSFMVDFDYEKKNYNRIIDVGSHEKISIGGRKDCDIYITDDYLGNDSILLKKEENRWMLYDNETRYGAFVNGIRIRQKAEIRNYDFFSVVGYSFYYKAGRLYTSDTDCMEVRHMSCQMAEESSAHFEYPKYNRNTRVQYELPVDELEIQPAQPKPQKPRKNIVLTLIPALVMLAMTILLRGVMGGGGTFVIYSAVSMTMGVVMSVITYIQESKQYKKEFAERIRTYQEYIEKKKSEIQEVRENELRIRNLIYESLEDSIAEANGFGRRLFERSLEDDDFLNIYLGRGTIESSNPVTYTKQEFVDAEDPLATLPEEVSEEFRYIENAPIVSDFHTSSGIGVVGCRQDLEQMIKNITLDIAIRHFYEDVKFFYIFDAEFADKMDWVRLLHNVENEKLDVRNIICDDESKNVLLEYLYSVLSSREAEEAEEEGRKPSKEVKQQYVIFVTDSSAISCHPLSKYIKRAADYGFTFVFFEEYEEWLPQGCNEIIRLNESEHGFALKTRNGDIMAGFHYPMVPDSTAAYVASKLGAVSIDKVTLEGQLTKNITMFEMLGIIAVEDLNLEERWANSQVYKTLAAPLGVNSKKEIVYLNIGDKGKDAHGPHGLVAGTTGSGKSEILQTYILSMATMFHPYEVGFVIIDFKGGGMANQFKNLPHLIGTITNIDGREINRSLLSIKAELVKRQEMFAESGVNHINDYIRLFKDGKVGKAMPHLIMIVDEFAELKSEHPDFMKELISAARIGRTLGVHLILATQKPAGVVDAQIWSNSKFKLCLKVQTKEDSKEVIKTPLAAEIVEAGRAYFQVGNNEIFELFQSAFSGANVPNGDDRNENVYAIYEKNIWGKKTMIYTNKKKSKSAASVTQLDAIVDYVNAYCTSRDIRRLPGICLPSLEDHITTDSLNYEGSDELIISTPIGLYDDPEQQRQGELEIEVSKDNIYIVGSAQTGKTVFLQTMLYGLIRKYDASQVNAYLVDCGSMVLKTFEDSRHVGGVVLSNEDEKCKNLFKLLNTLIIDRKKVLSGKGVGNYAAYLDAGYTDMPMVVVMIDNMAAFKEYFPNEADEINTISREAPGVGISMVITAATANTMSYKIQANFGKKYVLNCNDTNDYNNILGHCKVTPKENPGRGLFMQDKRILEYQTAMFGKSTKEAERSQELKDYIARRNRECKGKAIDIPMIPDKLVLSSLMQENSKLFRNKGILPIGMEFATVDYALLDIRTTGSLALLGDADSRERFVSNLLLMLAQTIVFHNVEAIIIDDKQKKFKECAEYGYVRRYTSDATEGMQYISEFYDELNRRQRELEDLTEYDTYMMLIIQNPDVFKKICADKSESKALADAMKSAGEAGAFVMLTAVENQAVGFNSPEVYKVIKDERKAVLFAPLNENKLFEVSVRAKPEPSFDKTMGYRFDGNNVTKIKIYE